MFWIRLTLAAYWLLLTLLLLVSNPLGWLWFRVPSPTPNHRGAHLLFFVVLAVLCWMSRLPLRKSRLLMLLVGYALLTETFQLLVPRRSVEGLDYLENLFGLALGAWLGHRLLRWRHPPGEEATAAVEDRSCGSP